MPPRAHILTHDLQRARHVGDGGHGVTWSPRDPRFAGSNPAEVDEFFQGVKILNTSPNEFEEDLLMIMPHLIDFSLFIFFYHLLLPQ